MIELTLTAPEPVKAVPVEAAAGLVAVDGPTRLKLQGKVDAFVADLMSCDAQSPEFGIKAGQISSIGQKEINALAGQSSHVLDRPGHVMGAEGGLGQALAALRMVVENLDPGKQGDLLKPRKLLGIIPLGSKLKAYFDSYASAQSQIQAILASLSRGRDDLLQDNIAIDTERTKMWGQMGKLEEMITILGMIDIRLEEKASGLDRADPAKAKALRDKALFYTRQRQTDLLTQMAVTVQGYLALDLIKQNNAELIKGVDRASTTTIAALRTAVTVAQALNSQRLVLAQISALNAATSDSIDAAGQMLRRNTDTIHDHAGSASIQVEALERAFANVYATMEAVDEFKAKALGNIKTTMDTLSFETEKAQGYINRSRHAGSPTGDDRRLGPA